MASLLVALVGEVAEAQAVHVDATVSLGRAADPLLSPIGLSIHAGHTALVGPVGLQIGYRSLREGDERAQFCSFAGCTPGPFDVTHSLRSLSLGVTYQLFDPEGVHVSLAASVGSNRQSTRFEHVESGEEIRDGGPDERSLGGSADLRWRPIAGPLRPTVGARYDRIFAAQCPADGTCFPTRNVWSISVGLSWVAPAR